MLALLLLMWGDAEAKVGAQARAFVAPTMEWFLAVVGEDLVTLVLLLECPPVVTLGHLPWPGAWT